jgi:aldose 1-epimerase
MTKETIGAAFLAAAALAGPADAATAERMPFGTLPDGRVVQAVKLDNGHGITATVITFGASLQSLTMPDRDGHRADIVLAPRNIAEYVGKPQFFGATVGRFANRIKGGRFTLDGKPYQLTKGPFRPSHCVMSAGMANRAIPARSRSRRPMRSIRRTG